MLLMKDGKYDEAEKEYREALRLDPGNADIHFNLAALLQDQIRYQEAEEEYRKAIELNPLHAEAHYNLASAHA